MRERQRKFFRKLLKPKSNPEEPSTPKEPSISEQSTRRWRIKTLRIDGIPSNETKEVVVQNLESIIKDISSLVKEPECRSLAPRDQESSTATAAFNTTLEADDLASRLKAAASSYGYLLTNHFDGITPLSDGLCSPLTRCSETKCAAKVDVVAVPGLSCHALGSWKSSDDKRVWLRDFLPRDLPHARVLLYGYDTTLGNSLKHQSMGDLGSEFWELLSAFRNYDYTDQRPIVFIGHSLGGLVIKEALVHAKRKISNSNTNSPFVCAGLIFFGVPNLGIRHDELNTMVDGQANANLIHDLVVDKESEPSNYMKKLNQQFKDLCKGSFRIAAFFEGELSPTLVKDEIRGRWKRDGPPRMLVTRESATQTGLAKQTEAIPCNNKNHRGLVKFDYNDDRVYVIARDRLRQMLSSSTRGLGTQPGQNKISVSQPDIEACLKSLAFRDMNSRKDDIRLATQGTCDWLLNHKAWIHWWKEHRSLLWVQGKPGSGKSTLLNYAVRDLEARENTDTILISFFIHGRGHELQKTQLGLYRSIVHQLLSRVPEAFAKLIEGFAKHCKEVDDNKDSWRWTIPMLQDHLGKALVNVSKSHRVVIFLDALDEAGRDSAVEIINFFRPLIEIPSLQGKRLHICFSCRYHPDLKDDERPEIRLDEENRTDISVFCRDKLRRGLYKDIGELLTERSEGVFIWVRLVVERIFYLDRRGDSVTMIRNEVERTPQEIEELYREIIQRDLGPASDTEFRNESLRLFQWICFSERPLERRELPWALAMGTCDESLESFNQIENAPRFIATDRLERKIKSLSCGLIELTALDTESDSESGSESDAESDMESNMENDTESNADSDAESDIESNMESDMESNAESDRESMAQFIHQTAKDYFISGGLSELENSTLDHVEDVQPSVRAQLQLSQDCLRYMRLVATAEASPPAESWSNSYFFLQYASRNWPQHFTAAEAVQSHADAVFDLFMQPPDHFFHAWSLHYPEVDDVTNVYQLSCREGLISLLNHALESCEDPERWLNIPNELGMTPLHLAAWNGHSAVVQRLIDTGKASLDVPDETGQTPLSIAATHGHDSIAQLLIKAGANIEAENKDGRTPLSIAAANGYDSTVQLLIKAGANIEAKDENGLTLLSAAAMHGYDSIVQLLIKAGADIETKDKDGRTPLSYARTEGYKVIEQLLIEAGATTEDEDSSSPVPSDQENQLR